MRKQDIENIKLGHRQLLFDFAKEQDIVMSCINNQIEEYGHVELDELVKDVRELHDLLDVTIIQYIFWFVKDLKFHFRIDEENLEPLEVKQILIESLNQSVKIVPNKSVDNSVFQDVKHLYQKLSEDNNSDDCDDQYEFARILAKKIKNWKDILKSYKSAALKPFFPFEEEINDCMSFTNEISAKLDSFSLIHAFYNNKDKILEFSDDVKRISNFYTQHITFWEKLIQSFEELNNNLSELIQDSDIAASFEKLKQILSSSAPYNKIAEAQELLNTIIQQCRMALLVIIDNMIIEMEKNLDVHNASPDLRNKSLYYLKITIRNRIGDAINIKSMNLCLIDAEEKFDDFLDKIKM